MDACPSCRQPLNEVQDQGKIYSFCPACRGLLISMAVLRKLVPRLAVNAMWQSARQAATTGPRVCPECHNNMTQEPAGPGEGAPIVDVCTRCELVWFDDTEFQMLPAMPREKPASPEKTMSPKAREALAMAKLQILKEQAELEDRIVRPEHWWQGLPTILRAAFWLAGWK